MSSSYLISGFTMLPLLLLSGLLIRHLKKQGLAINVKKFIVIMVIGWGALFIFVIPFLLGQFDLFLNQSGTRPGISSEQVLYTGSRAYMMLFLLCALPGILLGFSTRLSGIQVPYKKIFILAVVWAFSFSFAIIHARYGAEFHSAPYLFANINEALYWLFACALSFMAFLNMIPQTGDRAAEQGTP